MPEYRPNNRHLYSRTNSSKNVTTPSIDLSYKKQQSSFTSAEGVVPTQEYPSRSIPSAKNISVQAEWLRQSGRALSEPSETPRWRITPHPVSIPLVALHIALQSLFHQFFLLCRSPILNEHSGIGANCNHTSEWVHWVHACI